MYKRQILDSPCFTCCIYLGFVCLDHNKILYKLKFLYNGKNNDHVCQTCLTRKLRTKFSLKKDRRRPYVIHTVSIRQTKVNTGIRYWSLGRSPVCTWKQYSAVTKLLQSTLAVALSLIHILINYAWIVHARDTTARVALSNFHARHARKGTTLCSMLR